MHLRDSLSGDHLFLIKNLPITEQNFKVTWKKIQTHYENSRRIIYSHVSTLLNIRSMKPGTSNELILLFNSTVDAAESLKSLDSPVQHWDHILVPLIVQRLDQKNLMVWEDSVDEIMEPFKFTDLVKFLTKRLLTLEAVQGAGDSQSYSKSASGKSNASITSTKFNKSKSFKSRNIVKKPQNSNSQNSKSQCSFGSQFHYIFFLL